MDWSRVDYLCFYQLFGRSFWRHPFTAEDPLVSKWCNAKILQIHCFDEETNSYILDGLKVSKIFIFGWTIPLILTVLLHSESCLSSRSCWVFPSSSYSAFLFYHPESMTRLEGKTQVVKVFQASIDCKFPLRCSGM